MTYFITFTEGGLFQKVVVRGKKKRSVINFLRRNYGRFTAVFKDGTVYRRITASDDYFHCDGYAKDWSGTERNRYKRKYRWMLENV